MMNNVEPDVQNRLDAIFARLNPAEVEEFYTAYQQWALQQRINELRQRIDAVRAQQADNRQRIQETRPSAIALAALARLQSSGVSDIALLDAMLERGEGWLDQTMQRLDYFEQFDDFVSDDYTQWCQGALEGAFDWIDSLREDTEQETQLENPSAEVPSSDEDAGDVEALLLQRLATEDGQDDLAWQEAVTLKRAAIQPPSEESATPAPLEEPEQAVHKNPTSLPETALQVTEYIPQDETISGDETQAAEDEEGEDTLMSEPEQPTLIEFASIEEPSSSEEEPLVNDEQPTLVEFASIEELPPPEETTEQVSEQATLPEITIPEDIPASEEVAQNETNEPDEIEKSAPEEVDRQEQLAPTMPEPTTPVRNLPPKRGLIRSLLWILTGK